MEWQKGIEMAHHHLSKLANWSRAQLGNSRISRAFLYLLFHYNSRKIIDSLPLDKFVSLLSYHFLTKESYLIGTNTFKIHKQNKLFFGFYFMSTDG